MKGGTALLASESCTGMFSVTQNAEMNQEQHQKCQDEKFLKKRPIAQNDPITRSHEHGSVV